MWRHVAITTVVLKAIQTNVALENPRQLALNLLAVVIYLRLLRLLWCGHANGREWCLRNGARIEVAACKSDHPQGGV